MFVDGISELHIISAQHINMWLIGEAIELRYLFSYFWEVFIAVLLNNCVEVDKVPSKCLIHCCTHWCYDFACLSCVHRCRRWCEEGICSCTHSCARVHPHAHEYVFPGHSHTSLSACTGKTLWTLAHEHIWALHAKKHRWILPKSHTCKVRRYLPKSVISNQKAICHVPSRFLCLCSCPPPCRVQSRSSRPSTSWNTRSPLTLEFPWQRTRSQVR